MNNNQIKKNKQKDIRKFRTRSKTTSRTTLPSLYAHRSSKHFYMQVIESGTGKVLCAANDLQIKNDKKKPVEIAKEIGKLIATKAKEKGITQVVFNRGSFRYHGRIKAAADGAREGGLQF